MELKLIEKGKEEVSFIVKDINPAIANTIRRSVIEEVPTLAIDTVKVIKNSSAMYDEILAHRLGLIPLITDLKSYVPHDKCRCKGKGCAQCQLILTLKATGPKIVYSDELISKDPKVKAFFPKTPIVYLTKKQSLELEAKAVLGQGKEHVKFSPGFIYYRGYPQIKITDGKLTEECAEVCPVKIIKIEDKKAKITDHNKCTLCMACSDKCPEGIEVKSSDKEFIFFVESFGQLDTKELLIKSLEVMDDKLEELKKELTKLK